MGESAKEGGALFQGFLHLAMKEHQCHVYMSSKQINTTAAMKSSSDGTQHSEQNHVTMTMVSLTGQTGDWHESLASEIRAWCDCAHCISDVRLHNDSLW